MVTCTLIVAGCASDVPAPAKLNTLTHAEQTAGWILLFDGQVISVRRGIISEGRCALRLVGERRRARAAPDPHNAGDIVIPPTSLTGLNWSWITTFPKAATAASCFAMSLTMVARYGGNRPGVSTGRQCQGCRPDPLRLAYYALYQPPIDPATGKTLDATKPAGEWNHVRLVVSPEKCVHEINGVKYFEYILGSDDFNLRARRQKQI